MPYIKKYKRQDIDYSGMLPTTPGELNYKISKLIDSYIERHGGISYSNINEVIGVLECVKLELYRRIAAPYEDEKLNENGEVYFSIKTSEDVVK